MPRGTIKDRFKVSREFLLLKFLLYFSNEICWKNFQKGLAGQLSHQSILNSSSRHISICLMRNLVKLCHNFTQFFFSIGNHLPESTLLVEPFYKCFLKSIRTKLLCICSKANEVEISLNKIYDHLFPDYLAVLSSSIIFVFCLDNAL